MTITIEEGKKYDFVTFGLLNIAEQYFSNYSDELKRIIDTTNIDLFNNIKLNYEEVSAPQVDVKEKMLILYTKWLDYFWAFCYTMFNFSEYNNKLCLDHPNSPVPDFNPEENVCTKCMTIFFCIIERFKKTMEIVWPDTVNMQDFINHHNVVTSIFIHGLLFTIFHELGHLIHHDIPSTKDDEETIDYESIEVEKEADNFAIEEILRQKENKVYMDRTLTALLSCLYIKESGLFLIDGKPKVKDHPSLFQGISSIIQQAETHLSTKDFNRIAGDAAQFLAYYLFLYKLSVDVNKCDSTDYEKFDRWLKGCEDMMQGFFDSKNGIREVSIKDQVQSEINE